MGIGIHPSLYELTHTHARQRMVCLVDFGLGRKFLKMHLFAVQSVIWKRKVQVTVL